MAKISTVSSPLSIIYEDECVAFFAEIVLLFGVPKSVGQIYGLLYASSEPIGFKVIVERLEISTGSVGQGQQLLRDLGAINQAEKKDGANRGVSYEAELSLRQLLAGFLYERLAPRWPAQAFSALSV